MAVVGGRKARIYITVEGNEKEMLRGLALRYGLNPAAYIRTLIADACRAEAARLICESKRAC